MNELGFVRELKSESCCRKCALPNDLVDSAWCTKHCQHDNRFKNNEITELNDKLNNLEKENAELKEENEKSNVLLSDIIEAFTSRSYNDDFEMAQAGREIYELFYGGKDPKEVFHNAEVPKCSRQLLKEAKDLIKNIIRVTWGEGWNYDLGWKVEAEKFLKECEE